ncbi:MAG TPA: hypothetical protein VEY67_11025 [Candidatus Dormibacteraeota bacterium]|nr:hypothetical protein [Candidatus Dormibacteraeota bacterium]
MLARFAEGDWLSEGARRAIRLLAAFLSLTCAVIYALIGAGAIRVVTGDQTGIDGFGAISAAAFGLGALLLLFTDRRPTWALGALFQVVAIVMYFVVAEKRTPPFEAWGLGLKAIQGVLLVLLVALLARPPERRHGGL